MPTRSTHSGGSSEEDEGRPRRSRRTQSVDYGDMEDDENDEDSDAADEKDEPDDEDLEMDDANSGSEENQAKSSRKNRKKRPKAEAPAAPLAEGPRRKSSRSTKFQQSMAEPDGAKEFLEKIPSTKKRKSGATVSSKANSVPLSPSKSPSKRHARHRLSIVEDQSNDDDTRESDSDADDTDDEDESHKELLKIQRILACRTESMKKWKEICSKMQTSEVDAGSRWDQSAEDDDKASDEERFEERFLVKWPDLSYLHCSWETEADLLDQVENGKTHIKTFLRKSHGGILFSADERCDGDYFDPAFTEIERVLEVIMPEDSEISSTTAEQEAKWTKDDFGMIFDPSDSGFENGTGRQFLVKWCNTPYGDSTYEFERDLILNEIDYKEPLTKFLGWSHQPSKKAARAASRSSEEARRKMFKVFGETVSISDEDREKAVGKFQKDLQERVYKNGGQVRDYQAEGISWMISNYVNGRSSILADEMGLGKTLQTVSTVEIMANRLTTTGTFLIIAPLSTLSHWEREFRRWTDLNTIVYHGSSTDRKAIREYEFAHEAHRPKSGLGLNSLYLKKCKQKKRANGERPWMVQVVITTPEMIVADDFVELTCVDWAAVVVDEAHRLKNHNSKLAVNLRDTRFNFEHIALLTGTPIQNDVQEFWTLLNFIDPDDFSDLDDFMEKYGDMKSKDKVDELHNEIRPYILRRLKEDVEKSVPPKEETLIEVELTVAQKQYYRALYEKNVKFLRKDKKSLEGPSLNNLAMQLRKCCNHLYMLNGVESEFRTQAADLSEADFLAKGSGKLVLLDKLLPRLKEEGHRLLVFSQFKTMLDILEDYFNARSYRYERIDGSITGSRRQQAIDRFQAPPTGGKEPPFIMMLSTRAGGVGINLTAADTCVIFDSDWNPQNDLQAQARCHRIGQTKSVKVYRLLTRNTYEMQMFHMSSMKMGLDQAVLKGFESGASGEGALSKDEVEKLLRHGAYDIFNEEKAGSAEAESNAFVEQDLDSILQRRSRTVVHENTGSNSGAAGSTFSKASFKATSTPGNKKAKNEDIDIMDPDFWKKMVGEGQADTADDTFASKRQRKITNYSDAAYNKSIEASLRLDSDDDDDNSSDSEQSADDEGKMIHWGGAEPLQWRKEQAESVLKLLLSFGFTLSHETLTKKLDFGEQHTAEQTFRMAWAMLLYAAIDISEDDAAQNKKRDERIADKKLQKDAAQTTPNEGGTLGAVAKQEGGSIMSEDQYREAAFKKLWNTHHGWIKRPLQEALSYAKSSEPNLQDAVDKASRRPLVNPTDISSHFASSVWPSLKTRGWKANLMSEGEHAGRRCYAIDDQQFYDEEHVLREAQSRHPELKSVTASLLEKVDLAKLRSAEGQKQELSRLLAMTFESASPSSLRRFLERFAPLQLVADRAKNQPLRIPRKLLSTSATMDQATQLTKRAGVEAGNVKDTKALAGIIMIDKRCALPHPKWTVDHDAVLIQAILKHGWIDQESSCLAITNDTSIHWGPPFDSGAGNTDEDTPLTDWNLSDSAGRCCDFLNEFSSFLNDMKGFRVDHLVRTYGLEKDDDTQASGTEGSWGVSDATLNGISPDQSAASREDGTELPPKRELVRRAKAVVSKFLDPNPSSGPQKDSTGEETHGYAVLDQNLPPNAFLTELLRTILKTPGSSHLLPKLVEATYKEAVQLHPTNPESLSNSSSPKQDPSLEMQRIVDQLELVKKRITKTPRQCKNLIRVMLGEKPQTGRHASEATFPQQIASQKVVGKKSSSKPSGDRAISSAVKRINARGSQYPTGSDYLELTEVETLILMTICSLGLPPVSNGGDFNGSLSWEAFGNTLVQLADSYLSKAKAKAVAASENIKQLKLFNVASEGNEEMTASQDFLRQAEDVCIKSKSALDQATQYSEDADNLGKKAIMLMAKILQQMGPLRGASYTSRSDEGIGVRVLRWLEAEIIRYSASMGLMDEATNKPLAYTAVDFIQHLEVDDRNTIEVSSALDAQDCRNLVAQIAMMTRLRVIFALYTKEDELLARIWSATRAIKSGEGKSWEKRPSWWDEDDKESHNELLLLRRLLGSGFNGVVDCETAYGGSAKFPSQSFKTFGFTKGSIQRRANQLVRELNNLEEATVSATTGNTASASTQAARKPAPTQQTGLLSFYGAAPAVAKGGVDTSDAGAGKRKSTDGTSIDSDSKKPKTEVTVID